MCRSKAAGGQRCASHARYQLQTAERTYEERGGGGTRAALVDAWIVYASTKEGQTAARTNLDQNEPGPGGLPPDFWHRIASQGAALRERNQLLANIAHGRTAPAPEHTR